MWCDGPRAQLSMYVCKGIREGLECFLEIYIFSSWYSCINPFSCSLAKREKFDISYSESCLIGLGTGCLLNIVFLLLL